MEDTKGRGGIRSSRARAAHNKKRRRIDKLRAMAKVAWRETVGGRAVLLYSLKAVNAATEITNFTDLNLNEIKLKINVFSSLPLSNVVIPAVYGLSSCDRAQCLLGLD